nr:hypothetical protein [Tanacetum cinerariifolium]
MVNVIPTDHVDDVPIVEPNQHDDVHVVLKPILMDEDEDPEEEEFVEEENDIEVDIKEDENDPELTYPYEEVDPLNPSPTAYDSEPKDVIKVENTIESKDETVPASVYAVGESSTGPFLREENDGLLPGLMRKDINSLFGRMASLSRRLMEQGMAAMEKLVENLGNVEEKFTCKKLKNELEEARIVFEERPNEAIDVSIEDEKSPSFEPRGECAEGKKVNVAATTLFNELALMRPRMVEPERVKVDAYIRGLTNNIKGEVTSSKPANLNEAVRMAHKLMEQKSQARDERVLEGKKQQWESFQSGLLLYLEVVFLGRSLRLWLDHGTNIPNLNCLRPPWEITVGRSLMYFHTDP